MGGKRISQEDVDMIHALKENDESVDIIATYMGMKKSTVWYVLRERKKSSWFRRFLKWLA